MEQRPNILFIMCDQLRADALGHAAGGTGWVKTPAIDRIAAEGTVFGRAYTNSPVCVPARISLATGLYPHNYGLWSNCAAGPGRRAPVKGGETHAMDPEWPTWMSALRDAGYHTALVGKTHLHFHNGDLRDREHLINAYGLDDVDEIGGPRASTRVLSHMTEDWQDKGVWDAYKADYRDRFSQHLPVAKPGAVPLEDYADVYVGRRSKEWLEAYDGEKPWMLWVSFGGPHEPWDTPEPYASQYQPDDMPPPRPQPGWLEGLPGETDTARCFRSQTRRYKREEGIPEDLARELRANYAGNVSLIDDQIEDLLLAIEARGEMANTVIALVSDHGEMNGDCGLAHKSNFLDPAARIPFIVRTPATAERGSAHSSSPIELMDLGATFCALAGVPWEAPHFARSLCDAVETPDAKPRAYAICEHGCEAMICDGRYKAIYTKQGEPYLLFDLETDPDETTNRVADPTLADVRRELNQHLLQHLMANQLHQPGPRSHWWQMATPTP